MYMHRLCPDAFKALTRHPGCASMVNACLFPSPSREFLMCVRMDASHVYMYVSLHTSLQTLSFKQFAHTHMVVANNCTDTHARTHTRAHICYMYMYMSMILYAYKWPSIKCQ